MSKELFAPDIDVNEISDEEIERTKFFIEDYHQSMILRAVLNRKDVIVVNSTPILGFTKK